MKVSTYTPDYTGPLAIVYENLEELATHLAPEQQARVEALADKFDEQWLELQSGANTTWVYKVKSSLDTDARAEKMRQAGNALCLKANALFADRVAILGHHVPAVAEGAALGNYQFLRYFSDQHKRRNSLVQLFVEAGHEAAVQAQAVSVMGTVFARDLVNTPVITLRLQI